MGECMYAKINDTSHIFLEAVSSLRTSLRHLKWAVCEVRTSVIGRMVIMYEDR